MDTLEYSDIFAEIKGANCPGRLKLTEQNIVFKNNKTGKVDQIPIADLDFCNWQKLVGLFGLRLFLKNGSLRRFSGFKESEIEKISKYFKSKYSHDLSEKELSVKGWNWGTARFNGSVLSFDIGSLSAFEIPLSDVSQCTTGKNEVTVEFHQNDEAPVNLMEMRFHIPTSELAGDDPVDSFHKQVMMKASVISVIGIPIAIFREIQCLTPRGRYDIKLYQSFFQLHGKTFDYKIPMQTVLRLFVLPHKDGRQNYFVVSLDPPIKQGQTRYHYLVFLFNQDEDTSVELPFNEEELKEKYEGKLSKEMSGPTYDVISRIMKAIVNRKITVPGNFVGHSGTPAVGCSYKAAAGYIYPLERGFIYIHKPPLHIRFEEISSVNFARSGGSTRSFDFEIELKSGVIHTFSSIEKEEYAKLFDFISSKKLHVKNRGKSDKPKYRPDDFGNSDEEGEPDAYLARVKREAEEREEEGDDSDDDSTDEDFKPGGEVSDVAEEYDSNPTPTDSDSDSNASGGGGGSGGDEKKEKKKKKSKKKTITISEGGPTKRRKKKEKDENRPKRAPSAYMLWFNESREQIKKDNPGISFTDIAKKAGEIWKNLSDKSEWEKKAVKLKEEYIEALKVYKASGGGVKTGGSSEGAKTGGTKTGSSGGVGKKEIVKKKESVGGGGGGSGPGRKRKSGGGAGDGSPTKGSFISKEFIDDTDSSSSDDDKKKAVTNGSGSVVVKKEDKYASSGKESTPEKKKTFSVKKESDDEKKKEEDEDDEEEEILSTPTASSDDSDEKSKKKSKKKESPKKKKGGKEIQKKKKKDDDDDEEEILSSPTASSSSGDSEEDEDD